MNAKNKLSVKKRNDLIFGTIMLIVSVGYLILTLQVPVSGGMFNGRFFPMIIDAVMFLLTVLQFVACFKNKDQETAETGSEKDGRTVLYTVVLIVAYVALMQYLGFVLSTALYLFLQFIVMTPTGKKIGYGKYAAIAVVSSVAIYLVFRYTELNVMLPQGIFTII
mgnify:CR=1 FL=1